MAMNQCTDFHVPERMLFQWHVTDRCNLHCSHCYQDDDSHSDLTWNEHLTILEHILSFIRLCQDRKNGRPFRAHVTVTGGEPFVRDDFIPLLERLYEERQFFSLAILTNGTILTPAVVNLLKKVQPGFVQVSIDGTRATHDRIRGKGSYDRAIVGLKCLVNAGIPAYISFTAQRENYRDFPAVARLGRQLGVTRVWADRMVPCGRGGETAENLLTPAETRGFFALMRRGQKLGWLKSSRVKLHRSLQFTVTGDQPYRCSAGDTLVTIPNAQEMVRRPLEKAVAAFFAEPRQVKDMFSDSGTVSAAKDYQQALVSEGLLAGPKVYTARMPSALVALFMLLGVSITKIISAVSRGHYNVLFLAILTLVFAVWTVAIWKKNRTGAGDQVLREAQRRFLSLKGRAKSVRPGGTTSDASFLAAVYGLSVLPVVYFPYIKTIFPKAASSSSGDTGGGCCGGGCGSSGCGGGGCGGGCGGCGS